MSTGRLVGKLANRLQRDGEPDLKMSVTDAAADASEHGDDMLGEPESTERPRAGNFDEQN